MREKRSAFRPASDAAPGGSIHRTRPTRSVSAPFALLAGALAFGLGACSGGSGGPNSGELVIRSCSIGCSDGMGGEQVSCFIRDVSENQEISILFSEPIDASSINSATLQVTDAENGTSPEGLRFVDPLDPRRVVFRPSVSFASGGTSFSLETNGSYEVLVPGEAQGDSGPFIRSVAGKPNQSRLRCSIDTTQGVADIIPGDPQVVVYADVVTEFDVNGDPVTIERTRLTNNPNDPVDNIWNGSSIYFEFNELMFLPTVADNNTGTSPFIKVQFDTDGNLATQGGDRVDLAGTYEFEVDQELLTTSLVFTPAGPIPSSGSSGQRLLVAVVPTTVTDVAGNPVTSATGGGTLVGRPVGADPEPVTLPTVDGETFDDGSLENPFDSGVGWAESGFLAIGTTGGSGRLGRLEIAEGDTLTLDTDSMTFPFTAAAQIDVIGNPVGGVAGYPRTITVTDGVFELSSFSMGGGSTLNFTGSNVPRLVVRGECSIASGARILLNGESAPDAVHDSTTLMVRGLGNNALGGITGGNGGLGADRSEVPADVLANSVEMLDPNVGGVREGEDAVGIGGTAIGAGQGAIAFPSQTIQAITFDGTPATIGTTGFDLLEDPILGTNFPGCSVSQIGAPGSGGGYATAGGAGLTEPLAAPVSAFPAGGEPNAPTSDTAGGNIAALGLATPDANNSGYNRRILRWQSGHLVGGAGGGGGGNHFYLSQVGSFLGDCAGEANDGFTSLTRWTDHSGASGGAGGGALGILAGRVLDLGGTIDLSGGDGGSAFTVVAGAGAYATPGGGGSGGAIRLRAPTVEFGGSAEINVRGGAGGTAPWSLVGASQLVRGGAGANGLVRIEDSTETTGTPVSLATLGPRITPTANSLSFVSVAPGFLDSSTAGSLRPDSLSGFTSCWIKPDGNFLSLVFPEDDAMDLSVDGKTWTMDVVLDDGAGGTTTRPFRGVTSSFPTPWEEQHGNLLGYDLQIGETASPIVVRFQGARARQATLADPCDVDINDAFGEIEAGSLTPWVAHPADLNAVVDGTGSSYAINMIRYQVIFDRTNTGGDTPGQTLTNEMVLGVDNLKIQAIKD